MDIFIKPDAVKAAQIIAEERREAAEAIQKERSLELTAQPMGNITAWVPENHDKARDLKPWEKIAREALDGFLNLRSTKREEKCWMHSLGCTHDASVWVHELGFDLKELKAGLEFAQVNSADIDGPVPGFCPFHVAEAPAMLAERVYFSTPAIQWGYLPTRWFVRFTDGTSQRGPIEQINPKLAQPSIMEQYIKE